MAAAPLLLNAIPIRTFATEDMVMALDCSTISERVLVIIQMSGGNDGINTVIPLNDYDRYANLRPNIRIPRTGGNRLITLDNTLAAADQVGLHPIMKDIKSLYDDGWVNIVQATGYTQHNRSHFKSTDLILRGGDGQPENFNLDSGWMARFMENSYPEALSGPTAYFPDPLGIQLGDRMPSLGFHTPQEHAVAINLTGQNPSGFYSLISEIGGPPPQNIPNSEYGAEIKFIANAQLNTSQYAERITTVFDNGTNMVTYPDFDLANQLKTVARLLNGGSRTKVFLVEFGGFDTHVDQVERNNPTTGKHAERLQHFSQSVKAFMDDLRAMGIADRVLASTFSEFGRKAEQNDNLGTDHGTISPMFIFGAGVNPGVLGTNVDLTELQGGAPKNLQHDYRQVFGSLIQDWLGSDENALKAAKLDEYTGEKLALVSPNLVVDPTLYNCRVDNENPNPVEFIGEVGNMIVAQPDRDTWHTVELQRTYENPVVVMSPISFNNRKPCIPIVRNIQRNSFEFQVTQWAYLNGDHPEETVSYMVIEAGEHEIGDGLKLMAGNMANVDHNWKAIKFPGTFETTPIVLTQCIAVNGTEPAISRQFGINQNGFRVRLQEEEGADQRHERELLSWIAIEPGSQTTGFKFEAGSTGKVVNHDWYNLKFSQTYGADPVFISDMQTYGGSNTAALRYDGLLDNRVNMFVQEEQSRDQEMYHIFEDVGYLVFDSPGIIQAVATDPENPNENQPDVSCENTGQILWEGWNNLSGVSVMQIPVDTPPEETQMLTRFEAPRNMRDYFGARVRGYICPPMTGEYIFYIAADDSGELWLSTDDDPLNKVKIAEVPAWTMPGEWTKYPDRQKSRPIRLEKGQKYYVEALMKESRWMDHLAVGWLKPDETLERPIDGKWLLPWEGTQQLNTPEGTAAQSSLQNARLSMPSEVHREFAINCYPKPFDQEFYLAMGNPPAEQAVVQIFSVSGKQVFHQKAYNTQEPVKIDVSELASGMYIIKVTAANQVKSMKIAKR